MTPADVSRRGFLIGAAALGAAAVDACTGPRSQAPDLRRTIGAAPAAPTTEASTSTTISTVQPAAAVDILVLQTASSMEHYAAGVYTRLAGSGLVTSKGIGDAMRFFANHHTSHGGIFEGATGRAGGRPFTKANPALSATAEGRFEALRSEADAVALAYAVEAVAAATYAANATQVMDPGLVPLLVGIGAVEARHLTVLGTYLGGVLLPAAGSPYPPGGFLDATGAVAPGVGIVAPVGP